MLGDISRLDRIYIVCGYTDMRKSIDGLCAIIEDQLKASLDSRSLFLFCGRRHDRIKALFREPDGYVLIYKRLSVKGGYQWPRKQSEVRNLTWREFDWLIVGQRIEGDANDKLFFRPLKNRPRSLGANGRLTAIIRHIIGEY